MKNNSIRVKIFMFLLLFVQCKNANEIDVIDQNISIETDPVVSFFEMALQKEFGKSQIDNYSMLFNRIDGYDHDFYEKLSFLCNRSKEFYKILQNLPDSIDIWKEGVAVNGNVYFIADTDHRLYNFWLNELMNDSEEMTYYKKQIADAHGISPLLTIEGHKLFNKLDLSDYRIRRVVAIHYLSSFYVSKMASLETCQ